MLGAGCWRRSGGRMGWVAMSGGLKANSELHKLAFLPGYVVIVRVVAGASYLRNKQKRVFGFVGQLQYFRVSGSGVVQAIISHSAFVVLNGHFFVKRRYRVGFFQLAKV